MIKRLNVKNILNAEYKISTKAILRWIWTIAKGIRGKALLNILIGIADVSLDFLFIWATKWTIDIATGKDDSSFYYSIGLIVAVFAVQIFLSFSKTWVNALLGVSSNNKMQLRTFSKILNSAWNGTESLHTGDTMNRLITDSSNVVSIISDTVPAIIVLCFRLVGAFIFVYMMSPTIALLLICIAPVFILLSKIYMGKMRVRNREVRDMESKVQSILQESIQNHVVIKTLEQCAAMVFKLSHTQGDLKARIVNKTKFSSVSNLIVSTGFTLGYIVTFIWSVFNLRSGAITYGMMLAFIQLVGQIQGPFRSLVGYVPTLVGAFASAERLIEIENMPLEQQGEPIKLPGEVGIKVENLSYSYTDGGKMVLDRLSFDFKPGTVTAVVGETGCGKTTLVRLILAIISPTSGKLQAYSGLDGSKVDISPRTRCNIVYVPQGNTLLSGTVRDNLLLGKPEATDKEIEEVLKLACADFVFTKPEGLDFICGEKGSGLSEGQAQRLAIARALLRPGMVIVLDEATSALDKTTEERLIRKLLDYAAVAHKTVIAITHRVPLLENCSAILDFDNLKEHV